MLAVVPRSLVAVALLAVAPLGCQPAGEPVKVKAPAKADLAAQPAVNAPAVNAPAVNAPAVNAPAVRPADNAPPAQWVAYAEALLREARATKGPAGTKRLRPGQSEAAEKILAHADATHDQKKAAHEIQLRFLDADLFSSSGSVSRAAERKLDPLIQLIIKTYPKDPLAGRARFMVLRKEMNTTPGAPSDALLSRLAAVATDFPDDWWIQGHVKQQFVNAAERAARDGDDRESARVRRAAAAAVPTGKDVKRTLEEASVIGGPMPLRGPTLAGPAFDIAQYKGKVVLVDFWATWCGPCVRALPEVQAAYDKYHGEGFEVVAVSLDKKREALAKFVADKKLPWPQVIFDKEEDMGWDNPLAREYNVRSIPATFLIGRDGKVVEKDLHGEKLAAAIRAELNKGAAGR